MNNNSWVLFGNPTPTNLEFMHSHHFWFPSISSSSSLSLTRSDAQSAPPKLDQLFDHIYENSAKLLRLKNIELPPRWNIPNLIHALLGNETLQMLGYLQDTYYDVLLRGETSWLFEDISNFIDLINYTL